jgi:hypothetical protein
VRSGGWRLQVTRWSPATGHPIPTAGRPGLFVVGGCCFAGTAASFGFAAAAAAACFRARFLGGVGGGGDETKSGSTRRGLGRFLSSIIPASSSRGGCGGRRREMALPMQPRGALRARDWGRKSVCIYKRRGTTGISNFEMGGRLEEAGEVGE